MTSSGMIQYGSHSQMGSDQYSAENLFDFDFPDDLSVRSDLILYDAPVDNTLNDNKGINTKSKTVITRKRSKNYKPRIMQTYTGTRCVKANMSRRTRDTMLYAFPNFDRCDSLLFFPNTLAKYLNCGDIPSVSKLFESYLDKNCHIEGFKSSLLQLTMPLLVRIYEIRNELHPDRITCIASTEVHGNQIKAVGFSKFTYCKTIYDSVANMIKDTHFSNNFKRTWSNHLRYKIERENKPEEEKERYVSRTEFTLTIDDITKKIKSMVVHAYTTSMQPAVHDVSVTV